MWAATSRAKAMISATLASTASARVRRSARSRSRRSRNARVTADVTLSPVSWASSTASAQVSGFLMLSWCPMMVDYLPI